MIPFGPLTRKERPGVPQDHFSKVPWHNRFVAVDHRGRVTALVAEGPDVLERTEQEAFDALPEDERAEVLVYAVAVATAFADGWWSTQGLDPVDLSERELLEYFSTEPTADALADTPWHAKTTGSHSHSHSAMGSQGDDDTHAHEHSHSGDADHGHAHAATRMTTTPVETGADLAAKIAQLRERQARTPEVERLTVTAVTASGEVQLDMAVRWDPEATDPFARMGKDGTVPKGMFVSTLPVTSAGADLPQIVDDPGAAWHAILCVEGLRTDEDPGREIMPGACRIPDLPVSLRLQIRDEGGHYGAVTCGRIDAMERIMMDGYNAITGEGVFGTDEHGQTGQLLVAEQTQRFISIDPRDVTMEVVEVEVSTTGYYDYDDDCEPALYDWWVRYTDLVVGAATIVATPALPQSVIALASVELPATPIAVQNAPTSTIVAAAGALPPSAAFADPGFHVGDPRLVRQADGHYACPLTVEGGRVFGHVAYWGANHTGMPGQKRKPPHSPTYAYFTTGARLTAEGTKVPVGNLTMGCGHASTSIRDASTAKAHYASTRPAAAHYDGGFGAVQMADVAAGEDDFGIWVAGVLCDEVTEADVRKFESLGLSGDWREIAGRLHMVACLAVPVPGFPIAREQALVASAEVIDLRATRAGVDEAGDVYALVAAGRVRAVPPEERLSLLEGHLDVLLRERNQRIADEQRLALMELVGA